MKIGFFDSGVGGLSVLYEGFLRLKDASFVYYADRDNVPYGTRSDEQIRTLLSKGIEFLISQGCEAVVIACNTASSVASRDYRAGFNAQIVAMEPAVKLALDTHPNARVVVAATPVTIKGDKLKNLLGTLDSSKVDLIELPRLVEFAENADFAPTAYIKSLELSDYDIFVLGCTHFNYFKKEIKKHNMQLNFIDGNFGTIKHLANKLNLELLERENAALSELLKRCEFFISGKVANEKQMDLITKCLAQLKVVHRI